DQVDIDFPHGESPTIPSQDVTHIPSQEVQPVVLPPNVAAARDLLSQRAMSADDLAAALKETGVVVAARRLESLPERFPDVFARTDDGLLSLHSLRLDIAAAGPAPEAATNVLDLVDINAAPIALDD